MDPYMEQQGPQEPRRQGHGCLWGCLGTLLAVALIVAGVFTFGAWHFYRLLDSDSNLQQVMQTVANDPRAEAVLGKNIKRLDVEMHTYNYSTGQGSRATYVIRLAGSKGEGELKADLDTSANPPKIKLMILTGPDGREQYLVGAPAPNPMMDKSI
jgi:hypothetical protein